MRFATVISILLHAGLVGIWFILPTGWMRQYESEPIVPIEIISEAELSDRLSVPETRVDAEPEPEEEAPEPVEEEEPEPVAPAAEPEPVEEEPEPEPEPVPEPVEEEPDPEPEPEPEPVEEEPEPEPEPVEEEPEPEPEPEPEEQEPQEDELDLAALESALTDLDPEEERRRPLASPDETGRAAEGERDQSQVGLGDTLSASETSLLRAAMADCWNAQAFIGAPEPEKLVVTVAFKLNSDGSLRGEPRVVNQLQIRASGNAFWQVAERNAVNAVRECAPYDFLRPESYSKDFELNFNPAQMAGF